MKILFIFFILLAFSISPVFAGSEWDLTDKSLFYILSTSKLVDCFQTVKIYKNAKYHEKHNLFIERGVESFGKFFIPIYFTAEVTTIKIFSDDLSSPYRKTALGLLLGSSLFMVINNASMGVGFTLPF